MRYNEEDEGKLSEEEMYRRAMDKVVEKDAKWVSGFRQITFMEALGHHREQCVENLNDVTASDTSEPYDPKTGLGGPYHSKETQYWRDRIGSIDRVVADQTHGSFGGLLG